LERLVTTSPITLLGATWDQGLFAVRDGTVEQEIDAGLVVGLACERSGHALAIVEGKSIRRRSPDGRWTTLGTSRSTLACCTTQNDAVFVGTDDARVLRLESDGRFVPLVGFDRVEGREAWYAGTAVVSGRTVGPPLGVRSMCATSDHSILFANVHVGGIPRSTDQGRTWQPTIDVEWDAHQVCAHPVRPELVAAATGAGLALSRDGGATWTLEDEGLHARHCSAVAFVGDDILISASTDPFAKQGAVYVRAIDDGGPFRPVGGLPRWLDGIVDTGNISARGDCVAVADRSGHAFLSQDGGRTWRRIAARLPPPSGVLIVP
jgi:hypothetical protein